MDRLPEMNARLRRIFRGVETYGSGTAVEQAGQYRLAELLPVIIAQAKRNSAEVLRGLRQPVDLLVSLSGFSPETTILTFELLQPHRLLVIGSDPTREKVDVIADKLGLPPSRLDTRYGEPTDPKEIYRYVTEAAQRMADRPDGRPHIIIDITGGKKVMSASAALAAAQLDLPLCYLDSDYDQELRQAVPGTEHLVMVPNPTAVFGDRDMMDAVTAFKHGAYGAAHTRFARVANVAHEPARARFLRDLSDVYQAWCDLDLPGLPERVRAMRDQLATTPYRPPVALTSRLQEQLTYLDSLAIHPDGTPLLLSFYLLGEHYHRLGRHDFAALLYYRTIENAFTLRLSSRGDGFSCSEPQYALLHDDPTALTDRYRATATAVYGQEVGSLPLRVGLMDAAILLYILNDQAVRLLNFDSEKALRHLRGVTEARNRSVLAHGTTSIGPELSRQLGSHAVRCLRVCWALVHPDNQPDRLIDTLRFVEDV
jgi:CRISPR-associated protein (TIGR02710 family)